MDEEPFFPVPERELRDASFNAALERHDATMRELREAIRREIRREYPLPWAIPLADAIVRFDRNIRSLRR